MVEIEPGDQEDDLPPLLGEDGEEVVDPEPEAPEPPAAAAPEKHHEAKKEEESPDGLEDQGRKLDLGALPPGVSAEEAIRAAVALRAAAALEAAQKKQEGAEPISAMDAIKGVMAEAEEPKAPYKQPDEKTIRMITAISKDDFEECEDAIMQGADVNADCGAGMCALHIAALRGEMFLTELLIAHGANVNQRDLSGNTPLLYACHFYRQHQRGVQMVAQLLFHKADPFYRIKDGKLAGSTAHDLMEKACSEPNVDENVPRQMRAMLQLAMDTKEEVHETITQVWMSFKVKNKKLFQVSSKKDNYDYMVKNLEWDADTQAYAPVKLQDAASILEEKFTFLQDYLFTDEGDKVKVYVTFNSPHAAEGLKDPKALEVDFEFQAFDLKLRTSQESFRLRIDPLFGSIDAAQCKHRVSSTSNKVTLTLAKRHTNRSWPALQKGR